MLIPNLNTKIIVPLVFCCCFFFFHSLCCCFMWSLLSKLCYQHVLLNSGITNITIWMEFLLVWIITGEKKHTHTLRYTKVRTALYSRAASPLISSWSFCPASRLERANAFRYWEHFHLTAHQISSRKCSLPWVIAPSSMGGDLTESVIKKKGKGRIGSYWLDTRWYIHQYCWNHASKASDSLAVLFLAW